MKPEAIEKILSANDTGDTGGHQAGILVPKNKDILSFFPTLDAASKNPRAIIKAVDDNGREWTFTFIYYNNKFFGGTRNEYRLTGMTAFFREFNLKPSDKVILRRERSTIRITFNRAQEGRKVLQLALVWRIVDVE